MVTQRARQLLDECDKLKVILLARDIRQPQAHTISRPAEAVRIEDTGRLQDIDWDGAGAPNTTAAAAAASVAAAASAPPLPAGSLQLSGDLEWPPRSAANGSSTAGPASTSAPAAVGGSAGGAASWDPSASSTYSSHYMPSNQQLLQKHALFGPRSGSSGSWQRQNSGGSAASSGGGSRARYPAFDASPIDALWAAPGAAGVAAAAGSGGGSGLPDIGSLALSQQQQQQIMQPSAGPSLGPQEIEVQSMLPCQGQPGGTCAMPPPGQQALVLPGRESVLEAAAADAAGPKSLSKRLDLRDVHISVALMNDFLHYAANNTRR